jgi:adenylate cyclase
MTEQTPTVGMSRKLAAIFSADVAGYSRLMGDDEEATIRTLTAYRAVISSLIQHYRGRVVDSPGDNLLAEFASVVDAVRCAVEIQHTLKEKNTELPDYRQMRFRIGINLGDVIVEGERLYGDGVNIAARLESLSITGGICISGTVYDHVENKLALNYEYQGEQTVKNIAKPVRMYQVVLEDSASQNAKVKEQKSKVGEPKLRRVRPAHRWVVAGLLLIVATVGVVRYWLSPIPNPQPPTSSTQPLPLPDKPSIVVLPFVNMSKDLEQEYFSDGMTEDLTSDLSKISSIFVIARNSAFTYKGKAVKVQEVGRELGVRYVLEGSVRKADNQVRINAQLIDATTGGHLWSERYDRPLTDIFALQDDITQKIVAALEVKLTKGEQERLVRRTTDNLEAYDYFLRGRTYYFRYTKETNAQARQMVEKALALDPAYADACALLGFTYWIEWFAQWSPNPPQSLERFAELAHRAIALDDSLPFSHIALAYVHLWKARQYEQAITELQKAVTLAPNSAEVYFALAEGLNIAGRHAEALEPIHTAMRLNPHYPANYPFNLGWAYQETGQVEEARAAYTRAVNLNPDFPAPHLQLADLYSELGREAEARAEAAEILRISPNFSVEDFRQNNAYADRARFERFVANLRKAGLK